MPSYRLNYSRAHALSRSNSASTMKTVRHPTSGASVQASRPLAAMAGRHPLVWGLGIGLSLALSHDRPALANGV